MKSKLKQTPNQQKVIKSSKQTKSFKQTEHRNEQN